MPVSVGRKSLWVHSNEVTEKFVVGGKGVCTLSVHVNLRVFRWYCVYLYRCNNRAIQLGKYLCHLVNNFGSFEAEFLDFPTCRCLRDALSGAEVFRLPDAIS
jgi:hypothetical protein